MRLHTIHLPATRLAENKNDVTSLWYQFENIVAVKEGFCWPSFIFTVFWAIFYKLWKFAICLSAVNLLLFITLFQLGADKTINLVSCIGVAIFFGYLANDFRRSRLKKLGYREKCIVLAPTKNIAIRRFLNVFAVRR